MNSSLKINFIFSMILLLTLGACANTSVTQPGRPTAVDANPIELVASLEASIAAAKKNQIHVLSPDWFSRAEEFHAKAKKGTEKGSKINEILENVAKAQEALENAEETAKVARTMLPEVIESREKALSSGAADLGEDYDVVEKRFLNLTRAIENNNIRYTQKNAPKVNEAYLELELRAIKANTIDKVRPLIEQAENEKALKYVPQSLALAKKSLDDTDSFITRNRYAKQEINAKVQESEFMAQRAIILNNQSKNLEKMEPEAIALWMEENLHQITTQLSAQDVRNHTADIQVKNIMGSIQSLQNENRSLNDQLVSLRDEFQKKSASYESDIIALDQQIANLQGAAMGERKKQADLLAEQRAIEQQLMAERAFNEKYLKVQAFFRTHEAEVYKQRNQLVIRLKTIQFPVGTAIIMSNNYALLSKVQRAIQTFNAPSVVIEGHTDSTGSDEINQVLSEKRAEAVRDYLVANKTIPEDKIGFKGYGSTRPLASNTTPEGRAINRRIDVIITPSLLSGQ